MKKPIQSGGEAMPEDTQAAPADTTRMSAEALPGIAEVEDLIDRAWNQIELINMAAEAGAVAGSAGNAIVWGCIAVQELLDKARGILRPNAAEGGVQ